MVEFVYCFLEIGRYIFIHHTPNPSFCISDDCFNIFSSLDSIKFTDYI